MHHRIRLQGSRGDVVVIEREDCFIKVNYNKPAMIDTYFEKQ